VSLSASRRSELRAQAHKLGPVVVIGNKGLTDEVVKEIDRSLKAHELIKVRAVTDDRKARETWMKEICERLGAEPVQEIGKVLVIYRENPEEKAPKKAAAPRLDSRPPTDSLGGRLRGNDTKRTSRPRSRTPSPRPASEPRRRRPRTSR
jgi:RNA-binding protein